MGEPTNQDPAWENLVGKSCGKFLQEILVEKSCRKILWEMLWENLVGNSCGKLLQEMLQEILWEIPHTYLQTICEGNFQNMQFI